MITIIRQQRRWWQCLLVGLLLFIGVGCQDLNTIYGDRTLQSVNGVQILHGALDERFHLREIPRLGKRAENADLLIHVVPYPGMPDVDGIEWIESWLGDREGRQAVLFLRDGTMGGWLCRHWAEELRAELATADEGRRQVLEQQINRLLERAAFEDGGEPDMYYLGTEQSCDLFSLSARPEEAVASITGLVTAAAPEFMTSGSELRSDQGETLILMDDKPWAVSIPVADSRLLVVVNTQPLLDAAQVDHTCRRLLQVLIDDLAVDEPTESLWVKRLSIGGKQDPPPPNILALLFGRAPFSYVVWHLLLVLVAFLALRALHLARTQALPSGHLQRFSRHLEAFAWQLKRAGASQEVVDALAHVLKRKLPKQTGDPFATVRDLYGDAASSSVFPALPAKAAPTDRDSQGSSP
jgi:hypothetical protein